MWQSHAREANFSSGAPSSRAGGEAAIAPSIMFATRRAPPPALAIDLCWHVGAVTVHGNGLRGRVL
jgi:hypothetical protein